MRKFIFTTLISLLLSACSSGGGSSNETSNTTTTESFSFSPGLYTGTFATSGGSTDSFAIMITSNNKWAGADPEEASTGTVNGATLSNTFGFSATLESANSGTFTNGTESGSFSIASVSGLYDRTSSLDKLNGTWVDDEFTDVTGTATFTFNNGALSMTTVSGCSGTGNITTIDTRKNEYALTVTVSNCDEFNGNYSGFGFTDDVNFTDDQFAFVVDNSENFALFAPVKQ